MQENINLVSELHLNTEMPHDSLTFFTHDENMFIATKLAEKYCTSPVGILRDRCNLKVLTEEEMYRLVHV